MERGGPSTGHENGSPALAWRAELYSQSIDIHFLFYCTSMKLIEFINWLSLKTSNICSGRQQNVNISSNSSDSDENNKETCKTRVLKIQSRETKISKMFQASGDEEFTQLLSMTTNYPSWHGEFKEMIENLFQLSQTLSVSAKKLEQMVYMGIFCPFKTILIQI